MHQNCILHFLTLLVALVRGLGCLVSSKFLTSDICKPEHAALFLKISAIQIITKRKVLN